MKIQQSKQTQFINAAGHHPQHTKRSNTDSKEVRLMIQEVPSVISCEVELNTVAFNTVQILIYIYKKGIK